MTDAQAGSLLRGRSDGSLATQVSGSETDQQLLERFVAHRDDAAFSLLVQRHGRTVWSVCRRVLHEEHDVEDAFQAVFLVLARKAASIRRRESVGSWLYGVAYRTAMKCRLAAARREVREKKAPAATQPQTPWGEAACRELQRMLDEEVQLLAEKYRAPFVLCCLEGLSKTEAARELGWPEGTVSGRLAQARKLLHNRLARRGVTLSAVLTAVALVQNTAAAAVPSVVAHAAVQAALPALAGKATALSPASAALADNLIRTMVVAKVKAGIAAVLTLTVVVTGTSFGVYQMVRPPEAEAVKKDVRPVDVAVQGEEENFMPPAALLMMPIDEQVLALAFSPDGKRLVTAGARQVHPGQFKVWDLDTGRAVVGVRGISGVRSVAYSPDGKTVATADFSGTIRLRDASTGVERASVRGHAIGINSIVFSADGQSLVTAGLDRVVKLWDVAGLKERQVFQGHTDMIFSAAFFRDGKSVVTGGQEKTAIIWDVGTGAVRLTLRGHRLGIEAVAVSPDDTVVATASWDRTIKLWDAATGTEIGVLEGSDSSVFAIAFSPTENLLASATSAGTIQLWDLKTRTPVATLGQHAGPAWVVAFTQDGKRLASGSSDKTAKVWDVAGKKELATLNTSELQPIRAVAYAPDGNTAAVAVDDKTVQLRDAKTGDTLHILRGHTGLVTCLAFAPDGTLVTGSLDKTVKMWDAANGKELRTLNGHTAPVMAVAFAPDGRRLASAGDDKTIKLWDVDSGREVAALKGHEAAIRALAFAPNGQSLASGGAESTIKLWDLGKQTATAALKGHTGTVRALAFSRGGSLASASEDHTVRVWEPGQEQERHTLKAHTGEVWSLAFTPSGRTLVSGGQDGTVIQWDPVSGQSRSLLKGHSDGVTALAIHPDGEHLLSGSLDQTVLSWRRTFTMKPPLPVLYRRDFRGGKIDLKALKPNTRDALKLMKEEPEGLRISIQEPKAVRQATGLNTRFGIKGDFDVTMAYDLLKAERLANGSGLGASLYVTTDTTTKDAIMVARFNRPDGNFYTCTRLTTAADGARSYPYRKLVPTDVRSGKLRLVRRGAVVLFLAAEEGSNQFAVLGACDMGKEDVLYVRIAGDPGTQGGAPFEARIREFEVRAQGEVVAAPQPAPVVRPVPVVQPDPVVGAKDDKVAPKKEYAREYYHSFKGNPTINPNFELFGPESDPCVKFEPAGLRITIPKDFPKPREQTGVATTFPIKGDFEITIAFEILSEPDVALEKEGTGLCFWVDLGTPEKNRSSLNRVVRFNKRLFSTWNEVSNPVAGNPPTRFQSFPTQATTGRLRLVRAGSDLLYYVAEGSSDEFTLLHQNSFTPGDLKQVRILGTVGSPQASVDIRVTELRVRADSLPEISENASVAETPSGKGGLALAVALSLLLVSSIGVGIYLRNRRRAQKTVLPAAVAVSNAKHESPTASETIAVRCPGCDKNLKAKTTLAGKKLKCPQCGQAVIVPGIRKAEADRAL